jgi:hypothetical protein
MRYEVLTVVLMETEVVWDVTPCHSVNSSLIFLEVLSPSSGSVEPEDVNCLQVFTSEHGITAQNTCILWLTSLTEKSLKASQICYVINFQHVCDIHTNLTFYV